MELLEEFANIDLLRLHSRLKLVQIVRTTALLPHIRHSRTIRNEMDDVLFAKLPYDRLLKCFPQSRLSPKSLIQYSHAEMTLLRRYCGTMIYATYLSVFKSLQPIVYEENSFGSFLHFAINYGQIRYVRDELRNGFEQENVSSEVFPSTTDATRGLNALLSADLYAAHPNLCGLLLQNGFSARHSVDCFQLVNDSGSFPPDPASFARVGTASIWLVAVVNSLSRMNGDVSLRSWFSVFEILLRGDTGLPGILVFFFVGDGVFHAGGTSDLFSLTTRDIVTLLSPPNQPSLLELLPPTDRTSIVSDRVIRAVRTEVVRRRVDNIEPIRNLKPGTPTDLVLMTPGDDKARQLISRPLPLADPSKREDFTRGSGTQVTAATKYLVGRQSLKCSLTRISMSDFGEILGSEANS